jgi:hypothetical protein
MPADDGVWFNDDKDVGPTGPDAAQDGPEEPVARVQGWPRSFALKHCDLLSERENFKGGVAATAEKHADGGQD